MNYFRIRVDDNRSGGYTYAGSSPESAEALAEKAAKTDLAEYFPLLACHLHREAFVPATNESRLSLGKEFTLMRFVLSLIYGASGVLCFFSSFRSEPYQSGAQTAALVMLFVAAIFLIFGGAYQLVHGVYDVSDKRKRRRAARRAARNALQAGGKQ